eukprot:XP_014784724.1 PREDICTED: uncharacterized protein LOC106879596 [Octopus bimaculoides]
MADLQPVSRNQLWSVKKHRKRIETSSPLFRGSLNNLSFIVAITHPHLSTVLTSLAHQSICSGPPLYVLLALFEPVLSLLSGVTDYLTTEVSTSKQKKFPLVTFIDSPGLVDGDMKYPFDVNKAILWLGDLADLIFVFFDPIGQALCKRTLNIVEKLSEKQADRMRFYLTKADESGHENDRQRVMMQIVQELCKRPGLNRTGFDMPTIFVPSLCARRSDYSVEFNPHLIPLFRINPALSHSSEISTT